MTESETQGGRRTHDTHKEKREGLKTNITFRYNFRSRKEHIFEKCHLNGKRRKARREKSISFHFFLCFPFHFIIVLSPCHVCVSSLLSISPSSHPCQIGPNKTSSSTKFSGKSE